MVWSIRMDVPAHHLKQSVCTTRPPYREGRHPKAVKVYTVNNESVYLIIQGVPTVGAMEELKNLCMSFGPVGDFRPLDEYPCEDKYTEVYLVKYKKIQSSRFAKKKLDEHSFFGGSLHVFYAPEYELLQETRDKLQDRRQVVAKKIKQHKTQSGIQRQLDVSAPQSDVASLNSSVLPSQNSLPLQHTNPQAPSLNQLDSSHFTTTGSTSTSIPTTDPPYFHSPYPEKLNSSISQTSSQECSSEFQTFDHSAQDIFELPLPPQPQPSKAKNSQQTIKGFNKWRHYEYSVVPTAHSNLPPDYDGRLSSPKSKQVPPDDSLSQTETTKDKGFVQSLHQSHIVVKDYKPQKLRSTPRFVPRQAVKTAVKTAQTQQKLADGAKASQGGLTEDDNLRQNAFCLGKVQGPEEMPGRKRPLPTAAQQSVNNTIISIRSKISKVIGEKFGKNS